MPRRKSAITQCRKCLYATKMLGNNYACGYCLFTGHMRGCDVEGCTKFEKMNKKNRAKLEREFRYVNGKKENDEYKKYIGEIMTKEREI